MIKTPTSRTFLAIALWLAGTTSAIDIVGSSRSFTADNFFDGMLFDRPVHVEKFPVPVPGSSYTLLVVSQTGRIQVVHRAGSLWDRDEFDLLAVGGINGPGNDDGGLLGFAFHPDFARNRKYYVFYVAPYAPQTPFPGTIILEERTTDNTLLSRSGEAPVRRLLSLKKHQTSHNGGTLHFGKDGYLYVAIGDGGSGVFDLDLAQSKKSLHGKMLRIDVDKPDAFPADTSRDYAYPADNPFVQDTAWLPEIWAYGLRSPWKWDFHPVTGEVWLGDVGQKAREELSIVPRGGNLGWKFREGSLCFSPQTNCPTAGLVPPLVDFDRNQAQAIVGGAFYYGNSPTELDGTYFFADYMTGKVWSLSRTGDSVQVTEILRTNYPVSVNTDDEGRLFVVSIGTTLSPLANTGVVYLLRSPLMKLSAAVADIDSSTDSSGAPATDSVVVSIRAQGRVSIADLRGNPELFEMWDLNGNRVRGRPSGLIVARRKGSKAPPTRLHVLW